MAVEALASALEAAAAALVPGLAGDEHDVLEAVQSLADSRQFTAVGPRQQAIVGSFIGWEHYTGLFCQVASGTTLQNPPGSTPSTGSSTGRVVASEAVLLDLLAPKLSAITCGIEAACMLLRIDNCVAAAAVVADAAAGLAHI